MLSSEATKSTICSKESYDGAPHSNNDVLTDNRVGADLKQDGLPFPLVPITVLSTACVIGLTASFTTFCTLVAAAAVLLVVLVSSKRLETNSMLTKLTKAAWKGEQVSNKAIW